MNRLLVLLAYVACFVGFAPFLRAEGLSNIKGYRISLGYGMTTVNRQTLVINKSYQSPMALSGDYSLFLSDAFAVRGAFAFSLNSIDQSIFTLGGGGGATFYILGGANRRHAEDYLQTASRPALNLAAYIGFGFRSYNFLPFDNAELAKVDSQSVVERDARDRQSGSAMGLQLGLQVDVPVSSLLIPGLRLEYLQAFAGATSPEISMMDITVFLAFFL